MPKIIGNTTATPNPRPDWNQVDSSKADYILNKPYLDDVIRSTAQSLSEDEKAQARANIGAGTSNVELASDLSTSGKAADAKLTGDTLDELEQAIETAKVDMANQDIVVLSEAKNYTDTAVDNAKTYTDSAVTDLKNELLNGAGEAYDTLKELGDLIDDNTDAVAALETIAAGKADAEHTHDDRYYTETEINAKLDAKANTSDLASKVDKVDGKDLSTNDYTTADKDKLASIEIGAQVNVQADWSQTDETQPDYIKNKPASNNNFIILVDQVNGYDYAVQMVNGNLVSFCRCLSIDVTVPPNKRGYMEGEDIDTTGMVVSAVCPDGSTRQIENYTYSPLVMTAETEQLDIQYVECGEVYTASTTIGLKGIADVLIDFEYTPNGDGTYTLTSWSGTLNGEPGTELIVPDNDKLIV